MPIALKNRPMVIEKWVTVLPKRYEERVLIISSYIRPQIAMIKTVTNREVE